MLVLMLLLKAVLLLFYIITNITIMIINIMIIINVILDDLDSSRIGVVVCECGVSVFSPCGATG